MNKTKIRSVAWLRLTYAQSKETSAPRREKKRVSATKPPRGRMARHAYLHSQHTRNYEELRKRNSKGRQGTPRALNHTFRGYTQGGKPYVVPAQRPFRYFYFDESKGLRWRLLPYLQFSRHAQRYRDVQGGRGVVRDELCAKLEQPPREKEGAGSSASHQTGGWVMSNISYMAVHNLSETCCGTRVRSGQKSRVMGFVVYAGYTRCWRTRSKHHRGHKNRTQ